MQNPDRSIRGYLSTLVWLCLLLIICFVIGTLIQVGLRWQSITQVSEPDILSLTLPTVIATNTHILITSTATQEPSPTMISTQAVLPTVTLFPSRTPQTTKNTDSNSLGATINYTIRSGDTLSGIARRFDISIADLLRANPDINPSLLGIDDVLTIPPNTTSASDALTMQEYTVQSGESLFQIARQFNLLVETLREANPNIKSDSIDVGDIILIPVIEQLTIVKSPTATINQGEKIYRVRQGDTLLDIALRFNISLEALQAANPTLNSTRLKIGQPVLIPNP